MSEMYIHECVLPSHKACMYPDHPELAGTIKLRMIGVEDEAEYLGSPTEDTLNQLLQACVIEPEGFNANELVEADRYCLLRELRIHSYGDQYHINTQCPFCGHEESDKSVSLDDVPVIELDEDYKEPIEVALPILGKTVGVRSLRSADRKKIAQDARMRAKAQKKKPHVIEYVERIVKQIVTVDGEELKRPDKLKLVRGMSGRDRAVIEQTLSKYQFGCTDLLDIECAECGKNYEAPVNMTGEFFRPRFDE